MARKTKILGQKIKRGKKLPTGKGYRLLRAGSQRAFKASLIKKFKISGELVAVFRVLD